MASQNSNTGDSMTTAKKVEQGKAFRAYYTELRGCPDTELKARLEARGYSHYGMGGAAMLWRLMELQFGAEATAAYRRPFKPVKVAWQEGGQWCTQVHNTQFQLDAFAEARAVSGQQWYLSQVDFEAV